MVVKLTSYHMSMSPDYHPETDTTNLLSPKMGSKYRMLVSSALWATVLGHFDVMYAVSTHARYNALPHQGHLVGMIRVFVWLTP